MTDAAEKALNAILMDVAFKCDVATLTESISHILLRLTCFPMCRMLRRRSSRIPLVIRRI